MVTLHIPLNYSVRIVDNFFQLTHIRNPGVAFGLFADSGSDMKILFFIAFSGIAIVAILIFFYHTGDEKKMLQTGLILLFSGAIGNLIDRILYQEVIDFLDFYYKNYHWPAFNVADSCITVGVSMILIDQFIHGDKPRHQESFPSAEQ